MSYITTFDAAFWTSVVAMFAFIGYTYFFNKHYVSVMINVIENVSYKWFIGFVCGVMLLATVGLFIWSPQGAVTSMFWSTIALVVLYKPYMSLINKITAMGIDNLDKIMKEKGMA